MLTEPNKEHIKFGIYEKAIYEVFTNCGKNSRTVYKCVTTTKSEKEMIDILYERYKLSLDINTIVIYKTDSKGRREVFKKRFNDNKRVVFIQTLTSYDNYVIAATHNGYNKMEVLNMCKNKLLKKRDFIFESEFTFTFKMKSKHLIFHK